MNRNDVGRGVIDVDPGLEEFPPQVSDILSVLGSQLCSFLGPEDPDGLDRPGQDHGGKRRGEDESGAVAADQVAERGGSRDVAAHVTEGFA